MLRLYSIQSTYELLLMDSNTTLNRGNRLLITCVNIAYKIEDRYHPSIHFWDSGPWSVLYFPLFLLSANFYFLIVCCLIFVCCLCFHVFQIVV